MLRSSRMTSPPGEHADFLEFDALRANPAKREAPTKEKERAIAPCPEPDLRALLDDGQRVVDAPEWGRARAVAGRGAGLHVDGGGCAGVPKSVGGARAPHPNACAPSDGALEASARRRFGPRNAAPRFPIAA